MRIEIHTNRAKELLNKIFEDIENDNIKTWSICKDAANNKYLTHTPPQWFKKALLNFSTGSNPNRLIFEVTWYKNSNPDNYTKSLYIGRFTEELLEHYSSYYSKLEIFAK